MGTWEQILLARYIFYVVFVLPVVLSVIFGTAVMAQSLQEPDRDVRIPRSSESIDIVGLNDIYSTSESITIQISVSDDTFDCGDLYITIYDSKSKVVMTQSGYFDQCFASTSSLLPIDDEFSETIDTLGSYEIKVDLNDKRQNIISTVGKFSVR